MNELSHTEGMDVSYAIRALNVLNAHENTYGTHKEKLKESIGAVVDHLLPTSLKFFAPDVWFEHKIMEQLYDTVKRVYPTLQRDDEDQDLIDVLDGYIDAYTAAMLEYNVGETSYVWTADFERKIAAAKNELDLGAIFNVEFLLKRLVEFLHDVEHSGDASPCDMWHAVNTLQYFVEDLRLIDGLRKDGEEDDGAE